MFSFSFNQMKKARWNPPASLNYYCNYLTLLTWPETPLGADVSCPVVCSSAGVLEVRLDQARLLHHGPEGALLSQVRVDVLLLLYSDTVLILPPHGVNTEHCGQSNVNAV